MPAQVVQELANNPKVHQIMNSGVNQNMGQTMIRNMIGGGGGGGRLNLGGI
jgi:hypothetical protein